MKKTLFILCHADSESAAPIEAFFRESGVGLLEHAGVGGSEGHSGGTLDRLLANAGLSVARPFPDGWLGSLQQPFDEAMSPVLEAFRESDAARQYTTGIANAFFMDAWRALCRRRGIGATFLYVRNLPWQRSAQQAEDTDALVAFNVAAAVVRQPGADVRCFDLRDWSVACEPATSSLARLLQGGAAHAALPAAELAELLRAMPARPDADLCLEELQALDTIMAGRHLGALLLLNGLDAQVQTVSWASARRSAIYCLLKRRNADVAPTSGEPAPRILAAEDPYERMVFELRDQLRTAQAQLQELRAAVNRPVQRPPQAAARQAAPQRAAEGGTAGAVLAGKGAGKDEAETDAGAPAAGQAGE